MDLDHYADMTPSKRPLDADFAAVLSKFRVRNDVAEIYKTARIPLAVIYHLFSAPLVLAGVLRLSLIVNENRCCFLIITVLNPL